LQQFVLINIFLSVVHIFTKECHQELFLGGIQVQYFCAD